jgi:hypothetical protein
MSRVTIDAYQIKSVCRLRIVKLGNGLRIAGNMFKLARITPAKNR